MFEAPPRIEREGFWKSKTGTRCAPIACKREGFTLIELLVVLAIIAILAALIFPAIAKAKLSAQNAVCISNLRQQAIALTTYTGDHEKFPGGRGGILVDGKIAESWIEQMAPYLGKHLHPGRNDSPVRGKLKNVVACPGYNSVNGLYYWGSAAYGYNGHSARWALRGKTFRTEALTPEVADSQVVAPSRTIAIGDSEMLFPSLGPILRADDIMGVINGPVFLPLLFRIRFSALDLPLTLSDRAMMKRHGGKWNKVMCDGHVESGSLEKFYDWNRTEVLSRWSWDNQVH